MTAVRKSRSYGDLDAVARSPAASSGLAASSAQRALKRRISSEDLAGLHTAALQAATGGLAGMTELRVELRRQLSANGMPQPLASCAEESCDEEGAAAPQGRQPSSNGVPPASCEEVCGAEGAASPARPVQRDSPAAPPPAQPAPVVPVVPPVAMGPHVSLDGEAFFCESAAPLMLQLPEGTPAAPPAIPPAISAAPSPPQRAAGSHPASAAATSCHSPLSSSGNSSPALPPSHPGVSFGMGSRSSSFDLSNFASGPLSAGHAAEELFYRLNHARQTVDFVQRQAATYSALNRACLGVWEALDLCNELREYEAVLHGDEAADAGMPLLEHALQTAEACRLAFPQHDWVALVGLMHGLGKLLAHADLGAEPQWAVCGETFPVGCRFHPAVLHAHFFQANPDRRRRSYASPTGVYRPGCGLGAVCMSWSAAEYLYMVLAMNRTLLPPEALFLIRYQKFGALLRPGRPYGELLSEFDRGMLPMLGQFVELSAYRRRDVPGRMEGSALRRHYDTLLEKYIPQGQLRW